MFHGIISQRVLNQRSIHRTMAHSHEHHHEHIEKTLNIAIALTTIIFAAEVIGGFISGSLSLLGDAGHMLSDMFALFMALSAIKIAKKAPSKTKTYGYHRVKILAAFLNGLLLIVISIWIAVEAYHRLSNPEPIKSGVMLIVALIGLVANLYAASKLHGHHDLNVRSAFLHVLSDTLSSVAVIAAAIWIYFTGQTSIDAIIGFGIAVFIAISAIGVLRESVYVLLQFTPGHIKFDRVIRDIEKVKGVKGTHHVHIWSLASHINVIDAHIYTNETNMRKIEEIKKEIKKNLEKYEIKHATLEFECKECADNCKIKEVEF